MRPTRRQLLQSSAQITAGFLGLRAFVARNDSWAHDPITEAGYGRLMSDPKGLIDLPDGFRYRIISRQGAKMDDGLVVPGKPDGMAAFAGPYGLTVLIRNHELEPEDEGPFGKDDKLISKVNRGLLYDAAAGKTICGGGTTTIVYDTKRRQVVRQFLSLGGTIRNCAGGPTPWKSWITCEETDYVAGYDEEKKVTIAKDHGYNFEVPVTSQIGLTKPVPLTEMGRFRHEAVAVDPRTNIVYQTEDRDESLIYRFLPKRPRALQSGGQLQVLVVRGQSSLDTRNWGDGPEIPVGQKFDVEWQPIDDPASPKDDLRFRGFDDGAARFARGEGMWYGNHDIYFACTSGGRAKKGQIWKYTPNPRDEPGRNIHEAGKLELFIESKRRGLVENADNLTIAPWGDLIVCEDRDGDVVRLVGVTLQGTPYPFAMNHTNGELAGATFSPDGSTLFVNIQNRGLTLAITGPWNRSSVS